MREGEDGEEEDKDGAESEYLCSEHCVVVVVVVVLVSLLRFVFVVVIVFFFVFVVVVVVVISVVVETFFRLLCTFLFAVALSVFIFPAVVF